MTSNVRTKSKKKTSLLGMKVGTKEHLITKENKEFFLDLKPLLLYLAAGS